VALTSPLIFASLERVAEAGLRYRIPTISPFVPAFVEAGGLIAYGPVFLDLFRRVAGYVEKILRGARPAELPIQRPEKFELIVNLKTARALKLELPQSLVLRADRVIE
jgi:putative ABC transport system substrate-binding protein